MHRNRTTALLATFVLSLIPQFGCSVGTPALRFTGGDSRTATIPFQLRGNHIYLRGQVNGSDSLWFYLDSGAGSNVLNTSSLARLGLTPQEGAGRAIGTEGTVAAGLVRGATLRLAGLEFGDVLTASIPLDPVATQTGLPVDGIVGAPLFENAVVEIDYARSLLIVHAPGSFHYAGAGMSLPITESADRHPYVEAAVTLAGRDPVRGRFMLDTGSSQAVILTPAFVESHRAVATLAKSLSGRSGGVGGGSFNPVGRIERLDLGPYTLERPVTLFAQKLGGVVANDQAIGNIGGEVLRRFKVIFDFRGKSLILQPNALYGTAFEADMSGIVFHVREDGSHLVDVLEVQADSPAAEAGVARGDVIETVDGAPLDAGGLTDLRQRLRQPGVTVRFGLRRGEARPEVGLVTRRLI